MSETDFSRLASLCLADIILFNRKRSGEASRLTTESYKKVVSSENPVDDDVRKTLSRFEQALCENHIRIETRGKKGRKVAILLTSKMKKNLDFLIAKKDKPTKYIFKKNDLVKPIRGTDALRWAASEAKLKNPERVTSTKLRKQLATLSQVLNLTESDQDTLA